VNPSRIQSSSQRFRLRKSCLVITVFWAASTIPLSADEQTPDDISRPNKSTAPEVVQRLSGRILSGSEPYTEANFAYLRQLGVKTIISVDGAQPRAKVASQHGLRYVHIPIGYDGVSEHAQKSLTRAVRDTHGLIYVHCHHGKHRGPAAAAIACRIEGTADSARAIQILSDSGTSKGYAGLWHDVENFKVPAAEAILPDLVEVAKVESMAAAMANLSRAFDNLKLCRTAEWKTPTEHPNLVAKQEALLVQEGLHESLRTLSAEYDDRFRDWLKQSDQLATELYSTLKSDTAKDAESKFKQLEQSCKRCHKTYRD